MMKELDEQRKVILIKIGKFLCNKREENGYSIARIANITKISSGTLRAIEQAKYEEFPHLIFLRGFIRNYAKLLDLDSDWMVEDLNQVYRFDEQSIEKPLPKTNVELNKYWGTLLTIMLFAVGLGAGVYFLLNVVWYDSQLLNEQSPTSNSLVETDADTEVLIQSLFKLQLDLEVLERGWARITLDNQPPFEVNLQASNKYSWQANDRFLVTFTKGNLANIFLNGEPYLVDPKDENQLYTVELTSPN